MHRIASAPIRPVKQLSITTLVVVLLVVCKRDVPDIPIHKDHDRLKAGKN